GLSVFGVFAFLGVVVASLILTVTLILDPQASDILHKPNPVLHVPHRFAWIMVGLSFLVVGPFEEYVFRGFVFGGLLSLVRGRSWLGPAFFSSVLFALAHAYYGLVYGAASLAMFTELTFLGMAFAIMYYLSGGNLIVPALIHGLYDATGFMAVASSSRVGVALRTSLVVGGIALAAFLTARAARSNSRANKNP
ncbi:MAG TPA: CPBP family intramembrane glutamic endopeptidase, partial [Thermodesulfobacteriota bacterium]|nr:CPBP family intramembrane glutamic endopeptidase [Thermodesulfobacteriota bacterium]